MKDFMNLRELYNQEINKYPPNDQVKADREYFGVLYKWVRNTYYDTLEVASGTGAEEVLKQAVKLVNSKAWHEDVYSIEYFVQDRWDGEIGISYCPPDKKSFSPSYVRQYYWDDQTMHIFACDDIFVSQKANTFFWRNHEREYAQLQNEMIELFETLEKLKCGDQRYITLQFDDYDDSWFWLFADGNAYVKRSNQSYFYSAFHPNCMEKTSRFIVKQIVEQNAGKKYYDEY